MRNFRSKRFSANLWLAGFALAVSLLCPASDGPWTTQRANNWHSRQPFLVGSNFIPSTAINQLEMWQADSFDLPAIDRELEWAESLDMNTMRVFLHSLLWQQDSAGFLKRMDQFLAVSEKHPIRVMFVLLDSVWDPHPHLGKQREPRPHVHNSGWVQAPAADLLKDPSLWNQELKPYVVGVISHFRDDRRVLIWGLMNEPDNDSPQYTHQELARKAEVALRLLQRGWKWARSTHPSQPLTRGVWKGDWSDTGLSALARLQLENSDVITFHCYDPPDAIKKRIASLRRFQRPVICTEYMARPLGSTFAAILPILKQERVGGYNWGSASSKTQTIDPWDSWEKAYGGEPPLWFHDTLRNDGTPYNPRETEFIKQVTESAAANRP
jgi:hypothetical protein